jgi:ribosomal protein S18 acetylase RimI-like enzyme
MTLGFPGFSIRSAQPDDAGVLIDLMVVSSHLGLVTAWEAESAPGESWRDVARRGIADRHGDLGHGNIIVASAGEEGQGRVTGMAVLNAAGQPFVLGVDAPTPEQRAIVALLNRAIPALMIREIAVLPEARGQGIASALVETAVLIARQHQLPQLSLTVNDANEGAKRLYGKLGFRLLQRGPVFPHPTWPKDAVTLLMTRAV